MAGIKDTITDVLAKIKTATVVNPDGSTVTPYVRIWNNQLQDERDGKTYDYPKPAFFVEIVNPSVYQIMGEGYRNSDVVIRVHLVHEYMNADAGGYEQDLPVFDLRDQTIELLTRYEPAGCGPMECVSEEADYNHDNLYHYVMDFVCNFTDDKGRKRYVIKEPTTDLEIAIQTENETEVIYLNAMQLKAYSTAYTSTADGTKSFLVLDNNGNTIIGANIVSVTIEIKPLTGPGRWVWDPATSVITLLGDEQVDSGQTAFIIFQQQLATAN